jgi:hypothetical protein
MLLHLERRCSLFLQLLRMLLVMVLQVRLSSLLGGTEGVKVVVATG